MALTYKSNKTNGTDKIKFHRQENFRLINMNR